MYSVFTDGILQINFGWLNDNEDTKKIRTIYGESLIKIKDFSIPKDFAEIYVNIPIEKWYSHIDEFIKIIKEIIKQTTRKDI